MIERSFPQRVWHTYLYIKNILCGEKRIYWKNLSKGIVLRPLSNVQKAEIKHYWRKGLVRM